MSVECLNATVHDRPKEGEFKVIKKWRKAVSLVQRRDGTYAICRYFPHENKWSSVLYFTSLDDLNEFLDEMDEGFQLVEEEEMA